MSTDKRAFVTGSFAYGIPHANSDLDLVVYVSPKDLDRLEQAAKQLNTLQEVLHQCRDLDYIAAGGQPLRFGRLNLIVCHDEGYYEVWREGTRLLKQQAPVNRDFAVAFMRRLRKKAGYHV